jgi:hypothetical protein
MAPERPPRRLNRHLVSARVTALPARFSGERELFAHHAAHAAVDVKAALYEGADILSTDHEHGTGASAVGGPDHERHPGNRVAVGVPTRDRIAMAEYREQVFAVRVWCLQLHRQRLLQVTDLGPGLRRR